MKILIVHNGYLHPGGEDEVVKCEKKLLEQQGHDVQLYFRSNHEFSSLSFLQKVKFILKDIYWSQKTYDELDKLMKGSRPDVVHVHNIFFVISPSVYDVCRDNGLFVVQTLHNYRFLCPVGTFYRKRRVCEDCVTRGLKSAFLNRCWKNSFVLSFILARLNYLIRKEEYLEVVSKFITLSEFSREKFVVQGIKKNKIVVKPNFTSFTPEVTCNIERNYVLYVGALQDYRGIKTLLKCWELPEMDINLKIIGSGPLEQEVRLSAKGERVDYFGQKSLSDVIEYIRGAYCVVVPVECYDNGPRIIIEAYACGIPVVASNIGAIAEYVQEGQTGVLFKAGDEQDLFKKISGLWNDPKLVAAMGKKARQYYTRRFQSDSNYAQLEAIYKDQKFNPCVVEKVPG